MKNFINSKLIKCLAFSLLAGMNLSGSWLPYRVGILTDDYGIVTEADLDEEEAKVTIAEPFPLSSALNYWFCIEPQEYFVQCKSEGMMEPEGFEIGSSTFWVHANGKVFNFWTRRNFDLESCEERIMDWSNLMRNEVVCFSGSYIEEDESGTHWIIDRMKTYTGEWSWFGRPGETEDDSKEK